MIQIKLFCYYYHFYYDDDDYYYMLYNPPPPPSLVLSSITRYGVRVVLLCVVKRITENYLVLVGNEKPALTSKMNWSTTASSVHSGSVLVAGFVCIVLMATFSTDLTIASGC